MQRIDDELVARAVAWCSEAGRQATPEEVSAALAGLGWDELLAARALLADAPPARPLGPRALADIARGTPAVVAADREKEGRYREEPAPRPGAKATTEVRKRSAGPVIRRARDRIEPAPSKPRALPDVDELLASEGRAVLERLVRENGARRGKIIAALALGWCRADGNPPAEDDLSRLLDAHGLARGFERRERDELLYALRSAAGSRTRAAAALGLTPAAFETSLQRLGGEEDAESIESAHRDELRRRATLTERVRMLVGERDRLAELGLLEEVEADVRERLPHHVRALRAAGSTPLAEALSRSLAVGARDVAELAARFALDLAPRRPVGAPLPAPGKATPAAHRIGRGSRGRTAARLPRERGAGRPPTAADRPRHAAPGRASSAGVRRPAGGASAAPRSGSGVRKPSRPGPGRGPRRGSSPRRR